MQHIRDRETMLPGIQSPMLLPQCGFAILPMLRASLLSQLVGRQRTIYERLLWATCYKWFIPFLIKSICVIRKKNISIYEHRYSLLSELILVTYIYQEIMGCFKIIRSIRRELYGFVCCCCLWLNPFLTFLSPISPYFLPGFHLFLCYLSLHISLLPASPSVSFLFSFNTKCITFL